MRKITYDDAIHKSKRERMQRYRMRHPDCIRRINRESWKRNIEKRHAEQKRFREEHPLFSVHGSMMKRCGLRKGKSERERAYYEGLGITVCDSWRSFNEFEKWAIANGWRRGLQIDRINPDGNYCPENCRFVTPHQNALNRRSTIRIEWNGRIMPLMEVYDTLNSKVSYLTFKDRIKAGWEVERAATQEPRKITK